MSISVNDTSSTSFTPPSTTTAQGSSTLDKDQFLKLLVAQLKNQDPTQPQDPTAFIAQLAQFSSLEAQQNTNTKLDSLILSQASSGQANASSLIGKQVSYKNNSVALADGQMASGGATLGAAAAKVTLVVTNANGQQIRTLQVGAQPAGPLTFTWDGTDESGQRAPAGTYKLQASAFDAKNQAVSIDLTGSGVVSGVTYDGTASHLTINNSSVNMSDVTSIQERNTTP